MRKSSIAAMAAVCGLLAAACGGDEGDANAEKYEGEDAKVAAVIDRLGEAAREGDVKAICEDLITADLQKSVREASGASCAEEFEQNIVSDKTTYEVRSVEVQGRNAVAAITDQEDRRSEVVLVKAGDDWRIARLQ